jgi:hypothetical protein
MTASKFLTVNLNEIFFLESNASAYLNEVYQEHQNNFQSLDVLVLTLCGEASNPESWTTVLQQFIIGIKELVPNLKIILVLDSWYKALNLQFDLISEIVYVDLLLLKTYYDVEIKKSTQFVKTWDNSKTNILLLLGPNFNRLHRLRLLYKLFNTSVQSVLTWSLIYKNEQQLKNSTNLIPELSYQDLQTFLETNHRLLDNLYDKNTGQKFIAFDPAIYQNCLFQLIVETDFDRPRYQPWITEKTWTSIANRRPFVVAGNTETLSTLKMLGIRTFQEYLKIPNYDDPSAADFLKFKNGETFQTSKDIANWENFYQSIKGDTWPDKLDYNDINQLPMDIQEEILSGFKPCIQSVDELRLDAIVENVVDWRNNIRNFSKDIDNDVNYNYNRFVELARLELSNIQDVMSRYNMSGDVTDFMFLTTL